MDRSRSVPRCSHEIVPDEERHVRVIMMVPRRERLHDCGVLGAGPFKVPPRSAWPAGAGHKLSLVPTTPGGGAATSAGSSIWAHEVLNSYLRPSRLPPALPRISRRGISTPTISSPGPRARLTDTERARSPVPTYHYVVVDLKADCAWCARLPAPRISARGFRCSTGPGGPSRSRRRDAGAPPDQRTRGREERGIGQRPAVPLGPATEARPVPARWDEVPPRETRGPWAEAPCAPPAPLTVSSSGQIALGSRPPPGSGRIVVTDNGTRAT